MERYVGFVGKRNVPTYRALTGLLHLLVDDTFETHCGRRVQSRYKESEARKYADPLRVCKRCLSRSL